MRFSDINMDMKMATELITTNKPMSWEYGQYDRVYPYTTENIEGYMKDSRRKTVLSVVGSGDHYLDLVCKGADKIDSFDINRLSIYYLKLKRAAVSCLSKREFYEFMTNNASKHYQKVRYYLDNEALKFWDYYIRYFTCYTGIQDSEFFYPRVHGDDYIRRNVYMSNDGYAILQDNISKHYNEEYYTTDIYRLPSLLNKKYDSIYLSNISNYQENTEKFKDLVIKLGDYLHDGGELYYAYIYQGLGKNIDYYTSEIEGTEVLEIPGIYQKGKEIDRVLVLKK